MRLPVWARQPAARPEPVIPAVEESCQQKAKPAQQGALPLAEPVLPEAFPVLAPPEPSVPRQACRPAQTAAGGHHFFGMQFRVGRNGASSVAAAERRRHKRPWAVPAGPSAAQALPPEPLPLSCAAVPGFLRPYPAWARMSAPGPDRLLLQCWPYDSLPACYSGPRYRESTYWW